MSVLSSHKERQGRPKRPPTTKLERRGAEVHWTQSETQTTAENWTAERSETRKVPESN